MPVAFRPSLEPPSKRRLEREVRRPCFCLAVSTTAGILVFLIFAVSGWNVYDHQFSKTKHRFHAGDEVSALEVSSDLSCIFCDGYEVSTWEPATAYLLPSRAQVNHSLITYKDIFIPEIPTKRTAILAFYLLEDSNLQLSACRENGSTSFPSEVLFLRGEACYRKFHLHESNQECAMAKVPIPLNATCEQDGEVGHPVTLTSRVNLSDTYYLLVSYGKVPPSHHHTPGIIVNGTLARTHYNLQDAEDTCEVSDDRTCLFDTPWNSGKDVVVQFRPAPASADLKTTMVTTCQLRAVLWAFIFGVPPFVCYVLMSVLFGCVFCRKRRRHFSRPQKLSSNKEIRVGDRNNLVANEIVPQNEDDTITIQG